MLGTVCMNNLSLDKLLTCLIFYKCIRTGQTSPTPYKYRQMHITAKVFTSQLANYEFQFEVGFF